MKKYAIDAGLTTADGKFPVLIVLEPEAASFYSLYNVENRGEQSESAPVTQQLDQQWSVSHFTMKQVHGVAALEPEAGPAFSFFPAYGTGGTE
jgi:hypothetical protein